MTDSWAIINPCSGKQNGSTEEAMQSDAGQRLAEDPLTTSLKQDHAAEIHCTEHAGHAKTLARQAREAGVDRLFAVGGDGTLHEVINGLMDGADADSSQPTLVLLTRGTGNDLARSLNIPRDAQAALEQIDDNDVQPLDLIRISQPPAAAHERGGLSALATDQSKWDKHYLHNSATGGFSATMREHLTDEDKQRYGAFAYLKAAVGALSDITEYQVTLTVDGETLHTPVCAVVVANGTYAGGGMAMIPSAEPDDRRLDLGVVTSRSFFERSATFARFLANRHEDDPNIIVRRAKSVLLQATPEMPFHIDGEPTAHSPILFEIVPSALRILRPRED
jgi:YegS/Rv2252/BmrU family lipid kinase